MKIGNYIRETKTELNHVNWPTRKQAVAYTALVIIVSVGVSLFLGFFDSIFTLGLKQII